MFSCKPVYKRSRAIRRNFRQGLTLVEIMIALTMTLIVLGAMMHAFRYASQKMALGRAVIEMANRARSAEDFLRSDLERLTLDPRPYTDASLPNGYFEYIEGPSRDGTNASNPLNNYLGDVDDVVGMTIRAQEGILFRGRGPTGVLESSLAEVVWYTTVNDANADGTIQLEDSVRVHRRELLIRPDLGQIGDELNVAGVNSLLASIDISVRVRQGDTATTYDVFANDLLDLGHRANRFCHAFGTFPHGLDRSLLLLRGDVRGDDVMLTDVAAFDLQVYSPNATVNLDASAVLVEPTDPGYVATATDPALGAFVDLDHAGAGWFADPASTKSQLSYVDPFFAPITIRTNVYDTWTPFYESDGVNQDGDALTDEGTNGIDDAGTAAPDDNLERETLPPYAFPVRGVKVTIRLIEKGTKQLHQSSVIHSFVPE